MNYLKILVTGSSGFIGRALCQELLNRNYEVVGLDLRRSFKPFFQQYLSDITTIKSENPAFKGVDQVIHSAAMADLNEARQYREKCFRLNVYGTFRIAEICRELNIPLNYISTCCVYGNTSEHPTTEGAPTNPAEIYGATKLAAEPLVKLIPKWNILRYSTVVGPGMRPALSTYIFLAQAIRGQPFTIDGTGQQTRTWIYIDDLVDATIKTLNLRNETVNIAGAETHSVLEMAKMCAEVARKEYDVIHRPDRPGQVFHEEICIDKAKRLLNWEPKVDLREALRRSVDYVRGVIH